MPSGERLLRLVLQLAGRRTSWATCSSTCLRLVDTLRKPAAHLLHDLKLLLEGRIEHLTVILGVVQRLVGLHPEQGGDAMADALSRPTSPQWLEARARCYVRGQQTLGLGVADQSSSFPGSGPAGGRGVRRRRIP